MKTQTASQPRQAARKTTQASLPHRTLEDLLVEGLLEIYSAERQLAEALPELADAAHHDGLHDAFSRHYAETKRHITRLDDVFKNMKIDKKYLEVCQAMKGLIFEARKIISEYKKGPVRDSALIIAAQKVEHYEIACYGSLCELSDVLGYWNICDLLGKTLDNEEKTDEALTELAVVVNDHAHATNAAQDE
jgi:ferritin-like metal-binding protein YciE